MQNRTTRSSTRTDGRHAAGEHRQAGQTRRPAQTSTGRAGHAARTSTPANRGSVRRGQVRRGYARKASPVERVILDISTFLSTGRGKVIVGGGLLALALLILAIGLMSSGGGKPDVVQDTVQPVAAVQEGPEVSTELATEAAAPVADTETDQAEAGTEADDTTSDAEPAGESDTAAQAASSGEAPAYMSNVRGTWRDGIYAPEPISDHYLPVFQSAEREDKVIAITVDDCFQTNNLKQIVELAQGVGGKLTIFPIGQLMQRTELQEVLRSAHDIGFEIENHTWSHDGLYNYTDEDLAKHIFDQDRALDYVLGVNYHTHFLRPRGGDNRNDLRTHSYIKQLGYYGIAHWAVDGKASISSLKKALEPGEIYLFHCTNTDLAKLKEFIPYAASQGYQLLTMNELFGYEKNYEEPLTDDPRTREVIPLAEYERDYRKIKPTTYEYAAWEIQEQLIKKGYLTGEPDGIYGPGTAECAKAWQKDNGYDPDGKLTTEQQKKLFDVA